MAEWQPIETAPEDETPVLLCVKGLATSVGVGIRNGDWWEGYDPEDGASCVWRVPTHWAPLPEPPVG